MQTVLLLAGVLFHEAPIRNVCKAVGFPFEHLVYPQLAAGERSVSSQQAFDLVALAESARSEPRVRRILDRGPTRRSRPASGVRSTARHSSPISTGFSTTTATAAATSQTGRCPAYTRIRRRSSRRCARTCRTTRVPLEPATTRRAEREAAAAWTAFDRAPELVATPRDAAAESDARSPRSSGITSGASGSGRTWCACWPSCAAGTSSSPIGSSNAAGSTIGTTISTFSCRKSAP